MTNAAVSQNTEIREALQKLQKRQPEDSNVHSLSQCISEIGDCVPDLNGLLSVLFKSQPQELHTGCLPSPELIANLTVAKNILRRQSRVGGGRIWVDQWWPKLAETDVRSRNFYSLLILTYISIDHPYLLVGEISIGRIV